MSAVEVKLAPNDESAEAQEIPISENPEGPRRTKRPEAKDKPKGEPRGEPKGEPRGEPKGEPKAEREPRESVEIEIEREITKRQIIQAISTIVVVILYMVFTLLRDRDSGVVVVDPEDGDWSE